MLNFNPLYLSDGYKVGHKKMLAPGTTRLYGTWIPRSMKYMPDGIDKIVSFGQQLTWMWLNEQFKEHFFSKSWEELSQFVTDMEAYLGLPYDGSHFKELHNLGYLPMRVKALPEGVETPANVPHMTFVNTVDGFAWLPLYLETIVSSASWKAPTSATLALKYRRNVEEWIMKTDPEQAYLIPFMCHDFSARGMSPWDMVTSGLGHATSFRGSDTLPVIPAARYYYGAVEVPTNSVNASEHSVSTTKIFTVGEEQMLSDWLKIFDKGILSVVSDTFDLWKLITEYLPSNKEAIMSRDGKLVIRPDSGDPVDIICGVRTSQSDEGYARTGYPFKYKGRWYGDSNKNNQDRPVQVALKGPGYVINRLYEVDESEIKGVVELLWDIFGGTINEQGYKVLDPHIGVIYGDAINLDRQIQIYERLEAKGFAATNVVLGVGSFTYQFNTRDSEGWAAKGSWFEVEEGDKRTAYNIYKDPITDDGTKKSLKGLIKVNEDFTVQQECTWEEEDQGLLQTIFEDGVLYNTTTLDEIRERINKIV